MITTLFKRRPEVPFFFADPDKIERRLEHIHRRMERIRLSFLRNPEENKQAIDILLAYSQEVKRLQKKHSKHLMLINYEFRTFQ